MSLFQSILKSISQKIREKNLLKESVAEVIGSIIKTKIKQNDFKIKNGILIIHTHPTIKTSILFKKEEIKTKLIDLGINISTIN